MYFFVFYKGFQYIGEIRTIVGEKCLEKADFESDLQNSYQEQKKGKG